MTRILTLAALFALICATVPASRAADPAAAPPLPPAADGLQPGDTIVILASDTAFGPDGEDANVAARYYCANRGKLSAFVSKERPLEFRSQVFQQWSVITYRCVAPAATTGG